MVDRLPVCADVVPRAAGMVVVRANSGTCVETCADVVVIDCAGKPAVATACDGDAVVTFCACMTGVVVPPLIEGNVSTVFGLVALEWVDS